jgi:hypothetical protein
MHGVNVGRYRNQARSRTTVMSQMEDAPGRKIVPCAQCLRDVPLSEARIFEAVDYVAYFCGLECYARWAGQQERPVSPLPRD